MKLKIEIDMDNAAFDGDWPEETGRILKKLAADLEEYGDSEGDLRDINGNVCGTAELIE